MCARCISFSDMLWVSQGQVKGRERMEEGKYFGVLCFCSLLFYTPSLLHLLGSQARKEIRINCRRNLNCKLSSSFIAEELHFLKCSLSVSEFRCHRSEWLLNVVPGGAVWGFPLTLWKTNVSPLIIGCHLYLRARAASSLSFPSPGSWLLSCCLTLNRGLHVVH